MAAHSDCYNINMYLSSMRISFYETTRDIFDFFVGKVLSEKYRSKKKVEC